MQDMEELMALVAEEMKRQQYNRSSIDGYWVQWRKLLAYGKEIGATQFSTDFGHHYLLEKYGLDWREPFQNDKEPRWRVNVRRRAVSVLEQYQLHGTFLRNVYYPEREITTVFSDVLAC